MAADAPEAKKDEAAKKPPAKVVAELSEEDATLKANLELCVERAADTDAGVAKLALETLLREIRTATSSMTSVPKPLKFLRPHFTTLKETYESGSQSPNKALLADILSLLAMTRAPVPGEMPESLKYRLLGSNEEIGCFGHEYVRNLAGEIGLEFARRGDGADVADLMQLVNAIVPFHMAHNAEPEAVDLLVEVEQLDLLPAHCDAKNAPRTCLYLVSCAQYLPEPDNSSCLRVAHAIYMRVGRVPEALRVALMLGTAEAVDAAFLAAPDAATRQQLAHMLARAGWESLDLENGACAAAAGAEAEALREILSNCKLSEQYLALARDLDVMEPKSPEEIYKSHLTEGRAAQGTAVDSARANLAATFVNAFVNAGFGTDKLMTTEGAGGSAEGGSAGESVTWIYKNKDHGKVSATASLGCILLWDVDGGLPQIDKYLYAPDPHVVAGALLAVGITTSRVRTEYDPAFALIGEHVSKDNQEVRIGAILGLGVSYCGACKEDVAQLLTAVVADSSAHIDVAAYAALALGLVFVGSCHGDCAGAILQALMSRSDAELDAPLAKLLPLGLGLLFLGRGAQVDATLEVVKTLSERLGRYTQVLLEGCAYAGTGNVLQVQSLLAVVGERTEKDDAKPWADEHQSAAVLGIALVSMGEELGAEMASRALEHVLQYGETAARRAVPLALALLNASNPRLQVTDALGRLAHDSHEGVAGAAVLALGLCTAGTNNARVAAQLRQLGAFHYKDPGMLFLVRVAQGLVHLGKGLLTLAPAFSDRGLLSKPALACLLAVCIAGVNCKEILLGKHHQLLFVLTPAMAPRMLFTVDETGKPLPASVRVGEAVDVVGQAGRPKTITGFQTHTTPVLLAVGERAELATEQYIPVSPLLEGVVMLRKNPDYVDAAEKEKK